MKGYGLEFMSELKSKNDIVDVAGKYVVLEQRGSNFWGRCPFHHEKTASFCINSAEQFYYCFGCHKSGDVISLVMELESLDFNDAVKFLAERVKMPLPEVKQDDEKIRMQKARKERILSLLKDTALYYVRNLRSKAGREHLEYAYRRRFTEQTLVKFGVGASLDFDGLPKYLSQKGYSFEDMVASGAVGEKNGRYFDWLGKRLVIPLIDQFNNVIAFAGRRIDGIKEQKYLNTRETPVFTKGKTYFNLNNLKKLKNEKGLDYVIMVEGHLDVISLVQAGVENVVASMGTALTKEQARQIKRYTEKVYISFDGDFAGQKASIRGLDILTEEGVEVKVITLPDGKDPDDVVKEGGKSAYDELVLKAKPLIDFKLDTLKSEYDLRTKDGVRKFVAGAMKIISTSASAAEQEDLLKTVRDLTGVTLEALKRDLYSEKEPNEVRELVKTDQGESYGDKFVRAGRFVLAAYLFKWKCANGFDISGVKFNLPAHTEIAELISERQKLGQEIRFSDLYEVFAEEYPEELSAIAKLDTQENTSVDRNQYFEDCVNTLIKENIDKEIARVTALFKAETQTDKRMQLAQELNRLVKEKNKRV